MENVRLILHDFFITLLFHAGSKFFPIKITNPKPVIDSANEIIQQIGTRHIRLKEETRHNNKLTIRINLIKI